MEQPHPLTASAYFAQASQSSVFSDPTLRETLRSKGVDGICPLTGFQSPPPWATVRCLPQLVEEPTATSAGLCVQPMASLPEAGVVVTMADVAEAAKAPGAAFPPVPSAITGRRYRVFPLGPVCGVSDAVTMQPLENADLHEPNSEANPKAHSYVVVDGPCGEAVLRGSNVYAPGVWCLVDSQRRSSSSHGDAGIWPGARVVVLTPKHGITAPLKGSVLRRVRDGDEGDAKTVFRHEDYVAVGRGIWTVSWRDLLSKQQDNNQGKKRNRDTPNQTPQASTPLQGDAAVFAELASRNIVIVTTDTFAQTENIGPVPMPPPPASEWYSPIAEIALRRATVEAASSLPFVGAMTFMAQNISSFLPAVLLASAIDPTNFSESSPAMLLDACAAPGGKTSHLLGQLFAKKASSWFRLQACDRSASRAKSMQKLLQAQFPPSLTGDTLKVHCGKDVGSLLKVEDGPDPAILFDGIILDPPCTCLGLRPRLSPHVHGAAAIQASADYQRLLLTRCLTHLRPGGRLVYSTCTISAEENEETVAWILRHMETPQWHGPKAHLVTAQTPTELRFCASVLGQLAAKQVLGRVAICGDSESQAAPLMVFRFMPNPTGSNDVGSQLADGVGFFVAVFERSLE